MTLKQLYKRLYFLDADIKIHQTDRDELVRLLRRKQGVLLLTKETIDKGRSAK